MWTRALVTAFLFAFPLSAHADFSLVCDEAAQVEDVLRTVQAHGFEQASSKFRAYAHLSNDRQEPTCELSKVPRPTRVGAVVAEFPAIEFIPGEMHDVIVVELHYGDRILFGTLNRFVTEKKPETGV